MLSSPLFAGPTRYVVLYDAQCPLCRRSVAWLSARNRHGALRCLPLQTEGVLDALGIPLNDALANLQVVSRSGDRYQGADGVLRAVGALSGWGWLRGVLRLPGSLPVARLVYREVARRRPRDPNENCDGACRWHGV